MPDNRFVTVAVIRSTIVSRIWHDHECTMGGPGLKFSSSLNAIEFLFDYAGRRELPTPYVSTIGEARSYVT